MKKVFAILLTTVLLFTIAACTSQPPSTGGTTSNAPTTDSDDPIEAEMRTVSILGMDENQLWENREQHESFQAFNELLKKYNLNLVYEVVAMEQYQQVIQTRTAAALDLPDMVRSEELDLATILNLGKQGIFTDIRSLLDEFSNGNVDSYVEKYSKQLWNLTTAPDGNVYWIPSQQLITYKNDEFHSNLTTMVRRDWLDKVGLEMPTTLDEFRDALRAFQEEDVNESGKKDEAMIYNLAGFEYIAPSFGLPAGLVMIDIYDDTAKSPWLMKDELVEYITYINSLVDEGLIDVDALDKSNEVKLQKEKDNMVPAVNDWALGTWHDANVKEYGGFYEPTLLGKTKGDIPRTYAEDSFSVSSKFSITKNVKDKQAVATLLDLIYTEEYANLNFYGIEGVSHTVNEEGTKVFHPNFKDKDFYEIQSTGDYIWNGILPFMHLSTWESYILALKVDRPDLEAYSEKYCIGQEYWYTGDSGLAVPTDEENATLGRIQNDIKTYSDETLTKLCLGQFDIANIDEYIDTIKSLGVEEYVKIYQNRHDRYLSATAK